MYKHDNQERLIRCFLAVFPRLAKGDVLRGSNTSVLGWHSLATVTLLATIEEEFDMQFDPEQMDQLTSFSSVLEYLQAAEIGGATDG